ncbi:hypothetical protein BAUCODRAFT_147249 [Baudoinia panamericana UAMH 10762]|uniref:Apple domain-containing protein n=1 Tax=Baudoinia panamericana (strain UAMH 10762) TaxID=717646 RepID=M2ND11_BAUPA|nr:uncharacterized protein BAUCODRAFT_147249 [Baudoinia panamericana UAMH 10762]EMC97084.1 hypothetical protein BAUCODRAFT_147249 [Baudoinia panamericana UAMH 10762]
MTRLCTYTAALVAVSLPSTGAQLLSLRHNSSNIPVPSSSTGNECGSEPDPCPNCDGDFITDINDQTYSVSCNAVINATERYLVTSSSPVNSSKSCVEACDEDSDCLGAQWTPNGECIIASGEIWKLINHPGTNAFVKVGANGTNNNEPSPPQGECSYSNIVCPVCDRQYVTDSKNKTYQVFCDSQLFSEDNYSLQQWFSAQGCTLACDDVAWCEGSTYFADRDCELANGTDVFPQQQPGYTAFLPVPATTKAPQTSPSRYNTLAGYSNYSTPTSASATPMPTPTPACNLKDPSCPACEGASVTDCFNRTYVISCSSVPICDSIVKRANGTIQSECLEYCDSDPDCLVAIWDGGRCDLCNNVLDGTAILDERIPSDYAVFFPATYEGRTIANEATSATWESISTVANVLSAL